MIQDLHGWIDCNEYRPVPLKTERDRSSKNAFLIYMKDTDDVYVGWYLDARKPFTTPHWITASPGVTGYHNLPGEPSYWQPLPEFPQKEKQEE